MNLENVADCKLTLKCASEKKLKIGQYFIKL